ncbi:MAG: STAS domain-containing protein [Oscillospiraceae bacterium]|nr:STAS domain-containing protein [Oscillospiraceae bacterium]MCL2278894.1 STAS domain-containing protein [Oscillospiraceae bacterium]
MTIEKKVENGKTVLLLNGRLDTTTAPELQEMLIPEFDGGKDLLLDFTELVYVSSAGLRVLLLGEKTAKATGVEQSLKGVSDEIMEIFEMTGFADILSFE